MIPTPTTPCPRPSVISRTNADQTREAWCVTCGARSRLTRHPRIIDDWRAEHVRAYQTRRTP